MKWIDDLLNRITMYRLLVYGLAGIGAVAFVCALTHHISQTPAGLIVSLVALLLSCFITDRVLAYIWDVPSNSESWLITALILFLILPPGARPTSFVTLGLAGVVACASKFILVWNNKHLFNPAAFGAAFLSLTTLLPATWWVGSSALWPFTLLVGLAVVRKIRRFQLVLTFVLVSLALQAALALMNGRPLMSDLHNALLTSPLIFLGTIMLTEPATMPPRRGEQLIFAALVAMFYVEAWKIGPLYIYPEVALLLGNIYAFAVSPKFRARLRLKEIRQVSDRVYTYVFDAGKRLSFLPGQYMDWTLAGVPFDSRGNRRTFTIASSPTEDEILVGVKFYDPSSSYKKVMQDMRPGDGVYVSQLAGNFTLPSDPSRKLAFIAGGIGITPFRSMVKYLVDNDQRRDIVLLYVVSDPAEAAYKDVFARAAQHGVRTAILTGSGKAFGAETIRRHIPDLAERTFMLSGPQAMVEDTETYLRGLGVGRRHIRTDYFSGY